MRTLLGFLEQHRHERLLGLLHQLNDTLLDGILVLVQPAVDIVLHLSTQNETAFNRFCLLSSVSNVQFYILRSTFGNVLLFRRDLMA